MFSMMTVAPTAQQVLESGIMRSVSMKRGYMCKTLQERQNLGQNLEMLRAEGKTPSLLYMIRSNYMYLAVHAFLYISTIRNH